MSVFSRFNRRVAAAVKAFQSPALVRGQKSFYSSYAPYGVADLTQGAGAVYSKWGAAAAVLVNAAIFACVTTRAETVVGLPYRVVDRETRKPLNPKTEPLMRALRAYEHHYRQSFFQEWMYDRDITGEVFIEPLRNPNNGRVIGVDLLSTLNVTPQTLDNLTISGYLYTAGGRSLLMDPDLLIYDRNTIARATSIFGYSPVLNIIGSDTAGVMQAAGKAMLAYFNNDGVPATLIMPTAERGEFSTEDSDFMRRIFRPIKHASGKYATAILPYDAQIVSVAPPDLLKWSELLASVEPKAYSAFRVPRSVAGDSDSTRYQASEDDVKNYHRVMSAVAQDIAGVVNNALLPLFYDDVEPPVEFEFETASLDHIDAEERQAAESAWERGVITFNEYRDTMGYEPIEGGDVYRKEAGVEYVTRAELLTPSVPQVTVEPPPPALLPANVPQQREAVQEIEAYRSFVRAGTHTKRAFTWYAVEADAAAAIEMEIGEAEPSARIGVFDRWKAAYEAADGVTDYTVKSFDALPEPTRVYIKSLRDLGYAEDVISAAAGTHYAGVIAGKRTTGVTQIRFNNAFTDLMKRAADERISRQVFERRMAIMLDRYARQAFSDGFFDGGVYGYELEDDDERWVFSHVDGQASYIASFAAKLFADDALTADEINEKPRAWWSGSVLPAYNEGLLRASKDGAGRWYRGPTSDSCEDCRRMDGKVYRFSTWRKLLGGTLPPCKATYCGGFECLCDVKPSRDPITKGRPPALRGYRKGGITLEAHHHVRA